MMQIRRAQDADNPRILEFQAAHSMRGALPMRFDRAPDYFALHRCHAVDHRTWLAEDELGHAKGLASLVVRPGYLNERMQPVAYLGDLRLVPDRRLSATWQDEVRARLSDLSAEVGVQYAYCCMIRDNHLATQSLPGTRRSNRLGLAHWHGYSNVSVYAQCVWRASPRHNSAIRVVRAQVHHADALRGFLDAESRKQPFGCIFSEDEFSRRLQTWPNFGFESFLLALDARGNLLGCVAPWDAGCIKRIVLEQLPTPIQAIRHTFNLFAPLFGRPKIAGPGTHLQDIYLSHLQVRDRDPYVFAALLDAAWSHVRGDYSLMQLCLYDNDPLWAAMRQYHSVSVPMDLYTLTVSDAVPPIDSALTSRIPGFEIYLV